MNNFIFENKTKVYFGKGCVGEYLPEIAAAHGDKVLLAFRGLWKIRLIRRCWKAQSW